MGYLGRVYIKLKCRRYVLQKFHRKKNKGQGSVKDMSVNEMEEEGGG